MKMCDDDIIIKKSKLEQLLKELETNHPIDLFDYPVENLVKEIIKSYILKLVKNESQQN
jgi:hypothetical protein